MSNDPAFVPVGPPYVWVVGRYTDPRPHWSKGHRAETFVMDKPDMVPPPWLSDEFELAFGRDQPFAWLITWHEQKLPLVGECDTIVAEVDRSFLVERLAVFTAERVMTYVHSHYEAPRVFW